MKKFSFTKFIGKHYILKESLIATLLTMVLTFAVSFIPIKFEFSKAIRQEFLGFDIYDLKYANMDLDNAPRDTNIYIIEIAQSRDSIASQIHRIQKYSPAVLAIDAYFSEIGDPQSDLKLLQSLNQYDNIILGSKIELTKKKKDTLIRNFFETGTYYPSGFINFLGSDEDYSVVRNYPPCYTIGDTEYLAFSSAIIKKYCDEKFQILKNRKNRLEIINYSGNLDNFTRISKEQLIEYDSTDQLGMLHKKIVLLGYFVKDPPFVLEDLHFSPLNHQVAGKSFPDMYGVVIHANILSMVLRDDYANKASEFKSYLIATLIVFLFLWYMLSRYKKRTHPKHGKFLLIQFLLIVILLYLFLQVFYSFRYKVPLLPIMIALVLCVELLGVYKDLALWFHKKWGYKTVFNHKHII